MTGDPDGTVRPDPFGGAPGVSPFVWTSDEGPAEPEGYVAPDEEDVEAVVRDDEDPQFEDLAPREHGPGEAAFSGAPLRPSGLVLERQHQVERPRGLSAGLLVTLLVSGPILLIELNWRGAGLTAQPHYLWLAAFAAVALSFGVGGFLIGRAAGSTNAALGQAVALTLLSCGLLALAAVLRQLVVGGHFPHDTTYLWFVIEIGVLGWCACGGALVGRWWSLRSLGW